MHKTIIKRHVIVCAWVYCGIRSVRHFLRLVYLTLKSLGGGGIAIWSGSNPIVNKRKIA